MFSWVVKGVPQPPGKLGDEEKTNAPLAPVSPPKARERKGGIVSPFKCFITQTIALCLKQVKQVTFKEEKKQEGNN